MDDSLGSRGTFCSLYYKTLLLQTMGFTPSAGLPPVPTQACPWTALPLPMKMTLKGAAHVSSVRKVRRENMRLNVKVGSSAQSRVVVPPCRGDMYTVLLVYEENCCHCSKVKLTGHKMAA